MYIILGEDVAAKVSDRYLVLELDTIRFSSNDEPIKSYCVIDNEHVPLVDINRTEELLDLHKNLINEYRKRNWNFCLQALEHLKGMFRGELDTFYADLEKRCSVFQQFEPSQDWDGVLDKTE